MISIDRSDQTMVDQRDQVKYRAHDALGEREALPLAKRCGWGGDAHWNSRRMKPDKSSPTITIAMIASTMVSTKS